MDTIARHTAAYTISAQFVKSGGILRIFVIVMRLLQLAWVLCIASLLTILILQLSCGVIGYGLVNHNPALSNTASLLMIITSISYSAFFVLRAALLEFAKDYVTVGDLLEHLRALRLFCFMIIACSGKKPAYQVALAIYVIDVEYKITNVNRILNVRK